MDQDDDVEHLFSWLQTPELRYREFAGAREITDTVVTWPVRTNTAATPVQPIAGVPLEEEPARDQRPAAANPAEIAPQEPFRVTPAAAPPTDQLPTPYQAVPPPELPATLATRAPTAAGGGLLGGAYREEEVSNGRGAEPAVPSQPPAERPKQGESSLDAVFGRLAARKLPDPRDRLRHVPGLGPPPGRPR